VPSLRSHLEADVEAEEAVVWYEGRQPGLGRDFFTELERAYASILEAPGTWPLWPGLPESLGIRRFLLARFPYGIAYGPSGADIIAYAVAHLSRRPGYWKDRLRSR
jgi:hypothetical protein